MTIYEKRQQAFVLVQPADAGFQGPIRGFMIWEPVLIFGPAP
jgi:hypothetical protein